MIVNVAKNGALSLRDSDNMRAFSIVCDGAGASLERLQQIAVPAEENHYWLDADAVLELSGRQQDQQWQADFRAMLESVAPYGYFDHKTNRVKAHVEIENG